MESKITAPKIVSKYETEIDHILSEDHHVVEKIKCKACHGSGRDWEFAIPCDYCQRTGVEYEVKYGVEGGSPFVIVNDNTAEYIAEYCALRRANEESQKDRVRAGIKEVYKLPKIIRLGLIADGYDIDKLEKEGKTREIFRILKKETGDTFLLTNLNI